MVKFNYKATTEGENQFTVQLNKTLNVIFDEEAKLTEDFILGECCDYLNEQGFIGTSEFEINVKNLKDIINKATAKDTIGLHLKVDEQWCSHTYEFKYVCPSCKKITISYDKQDKCCPKCGQRLSDKVIDRFGSVLSMKDIINVDAEL